MGYESLSTIIVLVIAVIVIAVWLPARTANGMKRAAEHRQDRYSPSLRIVQAEDGRRFGDVKPREAKGAAMPASTTSAKLTPAHIAHVRELRKQSIRRRQILVGSLLAVTVLVLVLAFALHFSPLFALIPFALTVVVLALGANAARHAREWEQKVQRYERARKRAAQLAKRQQKAAAVTNETADKNAQIATSSADAATEEASTEVMESRQIRRALRAAEIEQAKAKAAREAAAGDNAAEAKSDAAAEGQQAKVEPSLTVRDERDNETEAADATSELASVKPARALDVFDMATSQDLISFSLGEPRNEGNAPESLEIKSTRQVSKAEPVEPEVAEKLIDEARAVKAADDAQAAASGKSVEVDSVAANTNAEKADAADNADDIAAQEPQESFREREEHAEVEAPAATSDSLSVGLDSILARRGN
ncbi:magnesium transporter [Bifidobacterium felsineum]|uniref:magnesium transporter n=1 Tax=Bifidobacterium felsineum TaxID=2045440 RepID=UPI001BDD18D2|nr:magnesium transporter [Bifidobacterium felsineum]MBT1163495.1 magnesium transporter [Bifidobacterium felsineum]